MTREVIELYDQRAADYDAWFSSPRGVRLFEAELAALRLVLPRQRPLLDVGCGTGVFSRALGVDIAIDPAREALRLALGRGIATVQGVAEALPLNAGSFSAVVFTLALCFVTDPSRALAEAARVLHSGGALIIAELNRDSAWGEDYLRRQREGDPFYSLATIFSVTELQQMLRGAGLEPEAFAGALLNPPADETMNDAAIGLADGAGFVCIRARKP